MQTLDHGAPVSAFVVAREMGHGGTSLVNRIYGHLGTVRHRAEVVEYRADAIKQLGDPKTRAAFRERFAAVRRLQVVA